MAHWLHLFMELSSPTVGSVPLSGTGTFLAAQTFLRRSSPRWRPSRLLQTFFSKFKFMTIKTTFVCVCAFPWTAACPRTYGPAGLLPSDRTSFRAGQQSFSSLSRRGECWGLVGKQPKWMMMFTEAMPLHCYSWEYTLNEIREDAAARELGGWTLESWLSEWASRRLDQQDEWTLLLLSTSGWRSKQ